jgi:hypothetical protein
MIRKNRTMRVIAYLGTMALACTACESTLPAAADGSFSAATADGAAPAIRPPLVPYADSAGLAHEADAEYQSGLADLMSLAPILGVPLVTSSYRAGYVTGLDEGDAYQSFVDAEMRALGCAEGFAAIQDYLEPPLTRAGHVQEVCSYAGHKVEPHGGLFAERRLRQARWAAGHLGESRQIETMLEAFEVGYDMGFRHAWEALDQPAHVERVVDLRCEAVALKIRPPLSPAQLDAATSKCVERARAAKTKFAATASWSRTAAQE